jgi:putative hemolysin
MALYERRLHNGGKVDRMSLLEVAVSAAPLAKAPRHRRMLARFMPKRTLPTGRIPVLPGLSLRLPIGPLAGAAATPSLGRIGSLEVRLARTVGEVKEAQALRYRVFYEEMSAVPDSRALLTRRDADEFDAICDHLLVIDHAALKVGAFGRRRPPIVGTYRLLRQEVAEQHGGFYTAREFDVDTLIARHPGQRFLELGRSCVLPAYRGKRTVELLWQGVWAYVLMHGIDVMIGCASLEGTDPHRLAGALSFLHHNARAVDEWHVAALPSRHVAMDRVGRNGVDMRRALNALPPLIKGYLRLGAMIGDGAVVDYQFGTTDVCMILPVARISQRYIDFYGADAGRRDPDRAGRELETA